MLKLINNIDTTNICNDDYYLYRSIILSIRKKNSKYINKALKLNLNFDKNLIEIANEIIEYYLVYYLSKSTIN